MQGQQDKRTAGSLCREGCAGRSGRAQTQGHGPYVLSAWWCVVYQEAPPPKHTHITSRGWLLIIEQATKISSQDFAGSR
jgi:hypothetical protein